MTFDIFDKTKVIKSGTMNVGGKYVGTNNIDVSLGGIGGLVQKDKIVVQNSGNNMNPFENFKKCGDKYLDFTKQ